MTLQERVWQRRNRLRNRFTSLASSELQEPPATAPAPRRKATLADVAEHEGSMAIVSAIIGLSRGLDIITTAEGIETERQFEIMRAAGVTLAQGSLFGRPCTIAEFNAGLERADRQKVAS